MAVLIDFEFRNSHEPKLDLVACCFKVDDNPVVKAWLYKSEHNKNQLKNYFYKLRDKNFVAYAVTAEARSFIALGLNPLDFKWVDLYLEYRCLSNQDAELSYGPQLIDGKVKKTSPKNKWSEDGGSHDFMQHSLAACTYKLLGKIVDTAHKKATVKKIITAKEFSEEDKKQILDYCASDVVNLNDIKNEIIRRYELKPVDQNLTKEIYLRGEYAARTAVMEELGYPVDVTAMETLRDRVPTILKELAEDINTRFKIFKWNKKDNRYSKDKKAIYANFEKYLEEHNITEYPRTEATNQPQLSSDLLEEKFQFKHNYPLDDFVAQYMRFINTETHIKSFRDKGAKRAEDDKFIFDKLGSDGRIRPYFGIYGSQTARSQPSSSYYLLAKSTWFRSMIVPPKGKVICTIDYASQEFLISALVSKDKVMLDAYKSGDVYLAFGKSVGAIPPEGTKDTHKKMRNLFKSTVLGLSYNMGYKALANKLRRDTGDKTITDEYAKGLIELFFSTYSEFNKWNKVNRDNYLNAGYIKLPDGWYMWRDNDNWRSVNNMPIQGLGSCIMRKAVCLAQDRGLDMIMTLHDALYIEFDFGDWDKVDILYECMLEAFCFYFDDKDAARSIRMDAQVFGLDCEERKVVSDELDNRLVTAKGLKFQTTKYYIPSKGATEYKYFKHYIGR